MSILAWIEDQRTLKLDAPKYNHKDSTPISRSQGLWTRCDNCGVILYIKHLKENIRVCFGCGYHLQMESSERISSLVDQSTWRPLDETLSPVDPLQFKDQKPYIERLRDAQKKTGLQDAIQTGTGLLDGIPIALGVMDFHFMGGSMGSVVGEKITRLIEYATQEGYTLVLVCASGGARMQEGIYSLMQMAKISSALQVYQSCANLLYISVITSPTTGGVTASFAMLGDLVFAEPKALIGFAGRRVIEQTLQEELPEDFQTAEYLLHHGLLDLIVPRCFLKAALSEILHLYKNAPRKRSGYIPYGVTNRLSFLEIESVLRSVSEKTEKVVPTRAVNFSTLTNKEQKTVGVLGSDLRSSPLEQSKGQQVEGLSFASPSNQSDTDDISFTPELKEFNNTDFVQKQMLNQRASAEKLDQFSQFKKLSFKTLLKGFRLRAETNSNVRTTDWLKSIELATTQKISWINQKEQKNTNTNSFNVQSL